MTKGNKLGDEVWNAGGIVGTLTNPEGEDNPSVTREVVCLHPEYRGSSGHGRFFIEQLALKYVLVEGQIYSNPGRNDSKLWTGHYLSSGFTSVPWIISQRTHLCTWVHKCSSKNLLL